MANEVNAQATNGVDFHHIPKEKDYGNGYAPNHLHSDMDHQEAVKRIRTAGSISISPELFEKLYLSPQNQVKGDLRQTFGNPTPLAICGFLISLSPLSCDLMGWRGTGGAGVGAAGTATYMFFGGVLMIIASVGEWLIGNTFPFVVFGSFGAYWLGFAGTLQPFYNAWGAYATDAANPASGLKTVAFNSSFGFFFLAMALLCFVYLICSLRTNVAFVIIFLSLVVAFTCITGAYWQVSNGNAALAGRLQKASGAAFFVTCASGWWIFFAIMLASLDFPISIPVGDLSNFIKPQSERLKEKEQV